MVGVRGDFLKKEIGRGFSKKKKKKKPRRPMKGKKKKKKIVRTISKSGQRQTDVSRYVICYYPFFRHLTAIIYAVLFILSCPYFPLVL